MSLFISFEGGDGSGKSTQAQALSERLRTAGVAVTHVREPGSTALGSRVREWLKSGIPGEDPISHRAELLLFAAARAELVAKVIRPILARPDAVVVADRYADSTVAYQGYGRGIPLGTVQAANDVATDGVMPGLTLLLDCPPKDGLARAGALQIKPPLAQAGGHQPTAREEEGTRFEEEPMEFHERVRRGYLAIARQEHNRIVVIDAGRPVEEVAAAVWETVEPRLGNRLSGSSQGNAGGSNSERGAKS